MSSCVCVCLLSLISPLGLLPARAMKRMKVAMSDGMKLVKMAKEKFPKASPRAAESSEQTLRRQQKNQQHMASVRAAESS